MPLPVPVVVAHAGAGATWQALLVVLSLGVAVVFVLVLARRVEMRRPDDLVLPLAGVAIASSLAPLGASVLSDWVGWAFPIGCVLLVALLLSASTSVEIGVAQPPTYGAVAVAAILAVGLYDPITVAWHPPPSFLPLAGDVTIEVTSPTDGAEVPAGAVTVEVAVTGGSVTDRLLTIDEVPADPEEAGALAVALDGEIVDVVLDTDCPPTAPCTEVTFPIDVESGEHQLTLEFRRGDGVSFTPLVTERVRFTAT